MLLDKKKSYLGHHLMTLISGKGYLECGEDPFRSSNLREPVVGKYYVWGVVEFWTPGLSADFNAALFKSALNDHLPSNGFSAYKNDIYLQ